MLNSQLWGELQLVVVRKGLQPVTLSLFGFPTCLLFPVIAICVSVLLEYSMPEFELNVYSFGGHSPLLCDIFCFSKVFDLPPTAAKVKMKFSGTPRTPAKDFVLCTPINEMQP